MTNKYDNALSTKPGYIIAVRCDTCGVDYDVRDVTNEAQHPAANHVITFDCPNGHHCEARRVWHSYDDEFLRACGIEVQREGTFEGHKEHPGDEALSNCFQSETPEDRERRLALAACLNADMIFCGVRDGLCYFEVYFTDEPDGPKAVLSLPTDGLTAERIANHAAEADRKRREAE
ncbi:MAG: hypothetical protein WBW85_18890 [Terriglobales bacterium]